MKLPAREASSTAMPATSSGSPRRRKGYRRAKFSARAGSAHPVDFAWHVFARLGLVPPTVLDAWHGLFSTGDARYFFELAAARAASSPA